MSNFSYLTSDAEQRTMTGIPIDPEHNRIYGCEAEYIIFGSKGCEEKKFLWFTTREAAGPESNIATAKTDIFAVRFVFNSIYALTDSSIDQMTLVPALSIQAASGGVIPYQIVQLTLKLALAMGESAIDLKTLTDGGKVPLMKTSTTWRSSVGGMINALKDKVTEEVTGLAKDGINESIGFIQDCIDGAVDAADIGVDAVIDGVSADLETALTGSLQEAVSSVTAVIETQAEKAFVGFFTEGKFDDAEFIRSVRSEIESRINGFGDDAKAYISDLLPFIESTLLKEIARSIDKGIEGVFDDGRLVLEDALYRNVMNEISGRINSFLEQVSSEITDKVREVTSETGKDLKEYVKSKGDEVAGDIEKQLAEKTSQVLDRYLPSSKYGGDMLPGGSKEGSGINEKILMFSYKDYLRLFLLLKLCGRQKDEALLRIADVIQLNVSLNHSRGDEFRLANAYTYAEIFAEIKVRSLLFSDRIDLLGGDSRYHAVSGY
jgi:gas vesicle protein